MAEPNQPEDAALAPLASFQDRLSARLEPMGLGVSIWRASGEPVAQPDPQGEFCCAMCADGRLCQEKMGQLAQHVCLEGEPATDAAPTGCCLLAAPLRQRRRVIGAVVACCPTRQSPDNEEFARSCSRAGVDAELMSSLIDRTAQYEADEARTLCRMLDGMVRDEQAKLTAQQELDTLSTNLASTYEELSLLYRISGSMKVTQSTMQFFQTICNDLLEVMEVEAAAVVIHPREHSHGADRVVHAGELPISDEQLLSVTLRYLFPRLGTGSRSIIENGFAERAAHLGPGAAKIRSLVAVPMMGTEKCKGVLMALNKTDGEFDSVDLKLVSSICGQAAVFLENHHLYEDLQDLLMGMLHALTASIDAKDPYTCGHSRRVAMLSGKLAEMCGFDEQRARRVYLAGLLHDIGKIGMPEGVLLKNGRLTQEEFESVKKHPRTGARIMSGIPQMEDLNGAILHHHERPDGRGYPDGLAGDEIPVEALIVGLADSFDAMTSSRTYRAALPLDAVITEVRRCSGTQFDPRLVEQLLSLDLHEYLEHLRRSAAEEVVGPMRL